MKNNYLSTQEKTSLEIRHRESRDVRERDRIKVVLLASEDWSISMIAQALRLDESTIRRHLADYVGVKKLTIESGGSASHLTEKQTAALVAHLEDVTYQTTDEIIAHMNARWSIHYSVPGLNKWLHRNGFSYKQPKGYPAKADKAEQAVFVQRYKRLKKRLKANEKLLFMDATHPSMATKITHGWIKKGENKPLATTGSRTRMNLVGALALNQLSSPVVCEYPTVNRHSMADFLVQLRQHYSKAGKLYLILDGASYHHAKIVKKTAKQCNIKLLYLPPYSPNLNPIERLWKIMNEYARNNVFFKKAKDFRKAIIKFFKKTIPKITDVLNNRINDNFQKLNYMD